MKEDYEAILADSFDAGLNLKSSYGHPGPVVHTQQSAHTREDEDGFPPQPTMETQTQTLDSSVPMRMDPRYNRVDPNLPIHPPFQVPMQMSMGTTHMPFPFHSSPFGTPQTTAPFQSPFGTGTFYLFFNKRVVI